MNRQLKQAVVHRIVFTVPLDGMTIPSPNDRLHFHARAKLVGKLRERVHWNAWANRNALSAVRGTQPGARSVSLTLLRGKGERAKDHDNLVAMLKPALDGIVDAGWLRDDSPRHLHEYRVDQGRSPTGRRELRISVEW